MVFFLDDSTSLSALRFCDLIVDFRHISHMCVITNSIPSNNKIKTSKEPHCISVSNFVKLALHCFAKDATSLV